MPNHKKIRRFLEQHLLSALLTLALIACNQKPMGNKTEESIKQINGTALYTKSVGQGESILVIHGGPGLNHHYLIKHLLPLAEDYRLIFYDQRLCGQSDVNVDTNAITLDHFIEDIEGLRQSFGIEKLNLMAHSWGGLLAMQYAMKYPDQVKSLILINSTAASTDINNRANHRLATRFTENDSIKRMEIMQTDAFKNWDADAIEDLMKIGFKHQFYQSHLIDSLDLHLEGNFAEKSRLLQFLAKDLTAYDFHSELKAIKAPTLLIYGNYDPLSEVAGKKLQQSITHAELKIFDHCGHFTFIEKPDKFVEEVRQFMHGRPIPTHGK